MEFEVLQAAVGLDGKEYAGGVHELKKPTREQLKHAAALEAVGAIKVKASREERSKMGAHLESQSESEKARAAAQRDGSWYEGNIAQFHLDIKGRGRVYTGPRIDPEAYVAERKGLTDG